MAKRPIKEPKRQVVMRLTKSAYDALCKLATSNKRSLGNEAAVIVESVINGQKVYGE